MGQLSVDLSAKMEVLKTQDPKKTKTGIAFPRYFTTKLEAGKTPYDEIHWETRTASIGNDKGSVIFEQRDVEVPVDWSQTATNIVASKYFYGKLGSPERETSVAQLVERVVDTIADWGKKDGYFKTAEDGENFRLELAHLMLTQKACFNSPVWFNVGVKETRGYGWIYDEQQGRVTKLEVGGVMRPQCSACFIVSVKDSLESILDLAKTEGMLFKWGSGTGSNLSALREEDAVLSGGGRASGPLSFMKGFDAFAGVIKSGGKTRRAAKMVILNADHPDVDKFIWCKAKEEKKAYTLVEAGYDSSLDGEAYSSIFFQNANNSVRATDDFMEAADARRRLVDEGRVHRPAGEAPQGARPDAPDRRSHAPVRRPGDAVRYHGQPLASVQEHGADQRLESLLGVHVPGRFGLQPVVAEPDEVRGTGRAVRCGGFPARRGYDDPGAGNHRR